MTIELNKEDIESLRSLENAIQESINKRRGNQFANDCYREKERELKTLKAILAQV